jgi:hypothetical protein
MRRAAVQHVPQHPSTVQTDSAYGSDSTESYSYCRLRNPAKMCTEREARRFPDFAPKRVAVQRQILRCRNFGVLAVISATYISMRIELMAVELCCWS